MNEESLNNNILHLEKFRSKQEEINEKKERKSPKKLQEIVSTQNEILFTFFLLFLSTSNDFCWDKKICCIKVLILCHNINDLCYVYTKRRWIFEMSNAYMSGVQICLSNFAQFTWRSLIGCWMRYLLREVKLNLSLS